MLVEPGTRGHFRCFDFTGGELWYFPLACMSAVRIMRLIHDALSRIQKYFKIQPLILHSVNLRVLWWNRSLCCSQPKRTEPTEDTEIYKQGIKPSDVSIKCAALQTARAPLDPESTTGIRGGGVGSDCTNCHVKAWILIPPLCFHIESANLNEPVYYVTLAFRADWITAANNEFAPVKC